MLRHGSSYTTKVRLLLLMRTSGLHNSQVNCAPRSSFGIEDFLYNDNSRPYTSHKKNLKYPNEHVSFKQWTVAYMEPFDD
ncbi:hypothetical protein RJ641_030440 [Dillenia turbinata]|uniref:Uncharacterized protein n=1 Tax=Dillenia turbinata TaxID=194707 RepID=A0AAN8W061_9MAGN